MPDKDYMHDMIKRLETLREEILYDIQQTNKNLDKLRVELLEVEEALQNIRNL